MRPRGSTRAKKPITKKEFTRLINILKADRGVYPSTKQKLRLAYTLLYITGCRINEIREFKKSDLEQIIANKEYSLTNATKTKRSRLIAFDPNGTDITLLKDIVPKNEGYLFCKNGTKVPMSKDGFKHLCNNYLHYALGELYSTHSFRAGYVTALHKAGNSIYTIKEDIGHTNIATTAKYIKVEQSEIAAMKASREW